MCSEPLFQGKRLHQRTFLGWLGCKVTQKAFESFNMFEYSFFESYWSENESLNCFVKFYTPQYNLRFCYNKTAQCLTNIGR